MPERRPATLLNARTVPVVILSCVVSMWLSTRSSTDDLHETGPWWSLATVALGACLLLDHRSRRYGIAVIIGWLLCWLAWIVYFIAFADEWRSLD